MGNTICLDVNIQAGRVIQLVEYHSYKVGAAGSTPATTMFL
jgi:hypothetical protein